MQRVSCKSEMMMTTSQKRVLARTVLRCKHFYSHRLLTLMFTVSENRSHDRVLLGNHHKKKFTFSDVGFF